MLHNCIASLDFVCPVFESEFSTKAIFCAHESCGHNIKEVAHILLFYLEFSFASSMLLYVADSSIYTSHMEFIQLGCCSAVFCDKSSELPAAHDV